MCVQACVRGKRWGKNRKEGVAAAPVQVIPGQGKGRGTVGLQHVV